MNSSYLVHSRVYQKWAEKWKNVFYLNEDNQDVKITILDVISDLLFIISNFERKLRDDFCRLEIYPNCPRVKHYYIHAK